MDNETNKDLNNAYSVPDEYRPISMWGYFGYELLFSIPCIGFILLCVFAFGGTNNINLKNFARSYFCFLIIGIVLILIFVLVFGAALGIGAGTADIGNVARTVSHY